MLCKLYKTFSFGTPASKIYTIIVDLKEYLLFKAMLNQYIGFK